MTSYFQVLKPAGERKIENVAKIRHGWRNFLIKQQVNINQIGKSVIKPRDTFKVRFKMTCYQNKEFRFKSKVSVWSIRLLMIRRISKNNTFWITTKAIYLGVEPDSVLIKTFNRKIYNLHFKMIPLAQIEVRKIFLIFFIQKFI